MSMRRRRVRPTKSIVIRLSCIVNRTLQLYFYRFFLFSSHTRRSRGTSRHDYYSYAGAYKRIICVLERIFVSKNEIKTEGLRGGGTMDSKTATDSAAVDKRPEPQWNRTICLSVTMAAGFRNGFLLFRGARSSEIIRKREPSLARARRTWNIRLPMIDVVQFYALGPRRFLGWRTLRYYTVITIMTGLGAAVRRIILRVNRRRSNVVWKTSLAGSKEFPISLIARERVRIVAPPPMYTRYSNRSNCKRNDGSFDASTHSFRN